jgi:hypothetical protein
VREMARVLRPGGLLIVTVPNVAYWRRRLELLLLGRWNPLGDNRAVLEPWRDPHIRFFNRGSMRRMIASADLPPIVVGGHGSAMLIRLPEVAIAALARVFPSLFGERLHAVARGQVLPRKSSASFASQVSVARTTWRSVAGPELTEQDAIPPKIAPPPTPPAGTEADPRTVVMAWPPRPSPPGTGPWASGRSARRLPDDARAALLGARDGQCCSMPCPSGSTSRPSLGT